MINQLSSSPSSHAVGRRLQHLFKKQEGEKAVTLDLAYFPTYPLISKQMAKKKKEEWVGGSDIY